MEKLPPEAIVALCLKLARYKKENKELLHYLLFEADDEQNYIDKVKEEIGQEFGLVRSRNFYQAKKTVRKILRITKKYIKYSGKKETEITLLLYFCKALKATKLHKDSKTIFNLYQRQLNSIHKALAGLHEDIQLDFQQEIEEVTC